MLFLNLYICIKFDWQCNPPPPIQNGQLNCYQSQHGNLTRPILPENTTQIFNEQIYTLPSTTSEPSTSSLNPSVCNAISEPVCTKFYWHWNPPPPVQNGLLNYYQRQFGNLAIPKEITTTQIYNEQIYTLPSTIIGPSTSSFNPSLCNTFSEPVSNKFNWQCIPPPPVQNNQLNYYQSQHGNQTIPKENATQVSNDQIYILPSTISEHSTSSLTPSLCNAISEPVCIKFDWQCSPPPPVQNNQLNYYQSQHGNQTIPKENATQVSNDQIYILPSTISEHSTSSLTPSLCNAISEPVCIKFDWQCSPPPLVQNGQINCYQRQHGNLVINKENTTQISNKQIYNLPSIISEPSTSILNPLLCNTISEPVSNKFEWQCNPPPPVQNDQSHYRNLNIPKETTINSNEQICNPPFTIDQTSASSLNPSLCYDISVPVSIKFDWQCNPPPPLPPVQFDKLSYEQSKHTNLNIPPKKEAGISNEQINTLPSTISNPSTDSIDPALCNANSETLVNKFDCKFNSPPLSAQLSCNLNQCINLNMPLPRCHKNRSRSRSVSQNRSMSRSMSRSISRHRSRSSSLETSSSLKSGVSHKNRSRSNKNKNASHEKQSRSRIRNFSKLSRSTLQDKQISSLELTAYKRSRSNSLSPNRRPKSKSSSHEKRSRSRSLSCKQLEIEKKINSGNLILSPVSKTRRTLNKDLYSDSDESKQIGFHNFEEYNIALKQIKAEFDEEYLVYQNFPELHPNYEAYYKSFSEVYDAQGQSKSKQCKEDLWKKFWETKFCDIKINEWKNKLTDIDMKFKDKINASNPILSSDKEEVNSYSFDAAITVLEKLSDRIGFLGITLKAMISSYRKLLPNSKEAYSMFTESENLAFLNMVLDKLGTLRLTATSDTLQLCEKAIKWIPKLLGEAVSGVKLFEESFISIDLVAIAKSSFGKSNSFTIDIIKSVLNFKGVKNPSFHYINELFFKICEIHFLLAAIKK